MSDLPAVTGFQLIRLLELDGWEPGRIARHGQTLRKWIEREKQTLVAFVPRKRASLPGGTLAGILGPKQTRLGRRGLGQLIRRHGLR